MKAVAILPAFLDLNNIKKSVDQIMPGIDILTDTEFDKNDADVVVITTFTPFGKKEMDKFPELKYIQVASTGYNNVDIKEARRRNLLLCNVPVANKDAVAEHVIGSTLALLKNFIPFDSQIRSGHWPLLTNSRELQGKIFGIIGMGAIGIKLVQKLIPFNVGIVYYDPRRLPAKDEEFYGITYLELDELVKASDIISVHTPLTKNTRLMFNEDRFKLMKENSIFINTARGEIVDEKALVNAIKSKNIYAAIDVFSKEPPDTSSELFHLENVLFSPHIAGVTMESQERFITETIGNLIRYSQGIVPLYRVEDEL
ncbi:NAD(P)-dependent oxidoreductase [Ferroplasma sp.]|uniref:2-hydroxyacid dehydrogenase n=1 Tax=Ferroplasma sp. TaxID=2591003 RepID=UPI00307D2C76